MYELKIGKITKISGSYYVALPPAWMKNNNLGKGDEIRISLSENGSLVIEPIGAKNATQ